MSRNSSPKAEIQLNDEEPSVSRESKNENIKSQKETTTSIKNDEKRPPEEERIEFSCSICDLHEFCDYRGKKPPFVNGTIFKEECFVMRDPFVPPPFRSRSKPEYFIVLGAECAICERAVCKRSRCSVFYDRTFCADCAKGRLNDFPSEVQAKFRKQLMGA